MKCIFIFAVVFLFAVTSDANETADTKYVKGDGDVKLEKMVEGVFERRMLELVGDRTDADCNVVRICVQSNYAYRTCNKVRICVQSNYQYSACSRVKWCVQNNYG